MPGRLKKVPFAKRVRLDEGLVEFVPIREPDVREMKRWQRYLKHSGNPNKKNAVEFASLAIQRWREARGSRADSLADLQHFIQDNPRAEVTVFVGAKARWRKHDRLIGILLFRRTWANNVYVHYITSHPEYNPGGKWEGSGIGTAITICLTEIAKKIDAGVIWGETTQNSVRFYEKLLGTSGIKDRLYIERWKYRRLNAVLKKKLQR
jgi:hypothetical protein